LGLVILKIKSLKISTIKKVIWLTLYLRS